MYWHKTHYIIKKLFSGYIWSIPTKEKKIYLTFDDGPIPDITEYVLDELKTHQAKATFFCVGHNIQKYPEIYRRILFEGHGVGNHTFNHMNGWQTDFDAYTSNVAECEVIMEDNLPEHHLIQAEGSKLFRPPYGKVTMRQANWLRRYYRIVMWDLLTGDFDANLSPEKCLQIALNKTREGSIVVFHDSIKSERNLRHVLPRYLTHFSELGYKFEVIR